MRILLDECLPKRLFELSLRLILSGTKYTIAPDLDVDKQTAIGLRKAVNRYYQPGLFFPFDHDPAERAGARLCARKPGRLPMTRPAFWTLISAGAIGLVTTGPGVAATVSADEGYQRVGERLLTTASSMQPGLHNFIEIGLALFVNVLANGALAWIALTLLRRLVQVVRRAG